MIEPGSRAAEFALIDDGGASVSLADLRGSTAVLVFYPLDFSPVCTDQLTLYQHEIDEFAARGATLYGISVDSAFTHKAFKAHLGLGFSLLADFEPKGDVSRAYDMYIEKLGHGHRGFVVIDPEGRVKHWHRERSALDIPSPKAILAALDG